MSVHYCCDLCREAGIEHVMEESCEALHRHETHHHDGCCHHENSCWAHFLQVSQFTQSSQLHAPQALSLTLLLSLLPTYCCSCSFCEHSVPFSLLHLPPPLGCQGQTVLQEVCRWIC